MKSLFAMLALAIFASTMTACADDISVIGSGGYVMEAAGGYEEADQDAVMGVTLEVTRGPDLATFMQGDQLLATASFIPRAQEDWVVDCHTMTNGVLKEVADLDLERLEVASLVIEKPVLVNDCGPVGLSVVEAAALEADPYAIDMGNFLRFDIIPQND